MIVIDSTTSILKDGSIVNFFDNGRTELLPNLKSGWNKPKGKTLYNLSPCHVFCFKTKQDAIDIFNLIEKEL